MKLSSMILSRKAMAIVAVATVGALAAAGTFAWTSLNAQMTSDWRGPGTVGIGPGGTLHDDYVPNGADKQVYVENWGDEPIFVRVRLSEYMELGPGAGLRSEATDPDTGRPIRNPLNRSQSLISGASIDFLKGWRKYNPYTVHPTVIDMGSIDTYWYWSFGGQKYYYPAPEGKRVEKSYVDQGSPADLTEDSVNGDGIRAKQTLAARAISMTGWRNQGSQIGNYWVLDGDGWCYWAAPLKPGEATGMLLNEVRLVVKPVKEYYYGINVEAQMATKEGNDLDDYTRFGDPAEGGWSYEGRRLMDIITGTPLPKAKEMLSMHLSFSGMGRIVRQYDIDFSTKKLLYSVLPDEPEGTTTESDLSDEKIADFMESCTLFGLADWVGPYIDDSILDGMQWVIRVEYADSSFMKTHGSNAYPPTWEDFHAAIYYLTGKY